MVDGRACCFIGHRNAKDTVSLRTKLRGTIQTLIEEKGVTRFLFGSRSHFDNICHQEVTKMQAKYPHVKRIAYTCKSEYACSKEEKEELERIARRVTSWDVRLKDYDGEEQSERIYTAGKASYVERNEDMINASDFCIFYYDAEYLPPMREKSKAEGLYQPKSGTGVAFAYAQQRKRGGKDLEIYNLWER